MNIELIKADYRNSTHCADLVFLLNEYALDPMGGGEALSPFVRENLTETLSKLPYVYSVLCYVDDKPAGLVNCIEGFSTFACKPVVNIHDVVVLGAYRGMGINGKMFEKVEALALARGACKLTLEVLEGNVTAQKAYIKAGFEGYELDPKMGKALFWQKKLQK